MNEKDTSGPAFPVHDMQSAMPPNIVVAKNMARGMTLRDYFADSAMQSIMSNSDTVSSMTRFPDPDKSFTEYVAARSYAMADAMLAERDK
jgi:hypothetical protein